MLRDAFSGARSRKSMNVARPSAKRISMKPPPPRLPANGCVTAIAKPTATAASTALPPFCSTATPTSAAVRLHGDDHAVPRAQRLADGVERDGQAGKRQAEQQRQVSSHGGHCKSDGRMAA